MPTRDEEQSSEQQSKDERAAGVGRILNDQAPPSEPEEHEPGTPAPEGHPEDVGESITTRGEDQTTGSEFVETGTKDKSERPTGTSTNPIQRQGSTTDD